MQFVAEEARRDAAGQAHDDFEHADRARLLVGLAEGDVASDSHELSEAGVVKLARDDEEEEVGEREVAQMVLRLICGGEEGEQCLVTDVT